MKRKTIFTIPEICVYFDGNFKNKKMKFDWDLILNVVIAVLLYNVLDKLVLSGLMAKIPTLVGGDSYESEI